MITLGQLVDLMDPKREQREGINIMDPNTNDVVARILTCCDEVIKPIEEKEVERIQAVMGDINIWMKTEETDTPEVKA